MTDWHPKKTRVVEMLYLHGPGGVIKEVTFKYELGQEWDWTNQDEFLSLMTEWVKRVPVPKRRGRPPVLGKNEILTAAARARAMTGKYTQIAARFGMTPKQLHDLVADNAEYFNHQVAKIRVTQICPCSYCVEVRRKERQRESKRLVTPR
jgi:hypothetical protein